MKRVVLPPFYIRLSCIVRYADAMAATARNGYDVFCRQVGAWVS
jgi:hypothetical protein